MSKFARFVFVLVVGSYGKLMSHINLASFEQLIISDEAKRNCASIY